VHHALGRRATSERIASTSVLSRSNASEPRIERRDLMTSVFTSERLARLRA